MDPAHTNSPRLLSPSGPLTGMSEASTPTTTITAATGGPYCRLSFIHMYVQRSHTHTHACGTMDGAANIPLERTPREGFLRTALSDKAKEAERCETGRAGKKSWRQVKASGTKIGEESPSPPSTISTLSTGPVMFLHPSAPQLFCRLVGMPPKEVAQLHIHLKVI